jgi:shikimate kinase
VVLVGFMGAGKSSVGRALAERLRVPFDDCDEIIEQAAGPISGIFAAAGEAGFREIEHGVVLRVLAEAWEQPRVVALGGGAVLSRDVRDALAPFAHVVWVTAPVEDVWRRVGSGEAGNRPLARHEARFRHLYEQRAAIYAQVARQQVMNHAGRDVACVVDDIVRVLAREASPRGGSS